jgi:ATP-dependent Clp protease ATP-binding subunit ClpB
MAKAEREGDLGRASELKYGTIPGLEQQMRDAEARVQQKDGERLLKEEVDEEDIADIISRWTHIPVAKLMEGEREKLLRLDEQLHERVVGQDEAVQAVAEAILRARAGLKDRGGPMAVSSSWARRGRQTELAKTLAAAMFDDERAMVRIDMSEYWRSTRCRGIGAPPGYIGHDEGGQLTRPYGAGPTACSCSMRSKRPTGRL